MADCGPHPFFNINTISTDWGKETEFNAVLEKSFMARIEMHF
jgi:hypothetical protein